MTICIIQLEHFQVSYYKILNEAAQEIGLDEISTPSMRKTFGYWHYQKYKDIALLHHLFNHANSAVTLCYIGVNQDIMDQSVSDFFLIITAV